MSPGKCSKSDDLRFWLALHRAPGIGSRRFAGLLSRFGSPAALFEAGPSDWRAAGVSQRTVAYLRAPDWRAVARDLAWLEGQGRYCLTSVHPGFPPLLGEIPDPPALLFLEGDPVTLARRSIAIVGSRNPTPVGCRIAHDWAEAFVGMEFAIISGLALGIDAAAHQGALDGRGITLAVSGAGPELIYPRQHRKLAERIVAEGGSLVTEFPTGTEPKAVNFPRRNRIISGLALGTLVVEAAPRSGSLITARLAVEQNREVFAVPGSIDNPLSRGCNDLIKEGGAKLVQSVGDVVDELTSWADFAPNLGAPDVQGQAQEGESGLLKCIAYAPTSVDTLIAATGKSAEAVCSELLLLELQGYVASTPGGGYMRIK